MFVLPLKKVFLNYYGLSYFSSKGLTSCIITFFWTGASTFFIFSLLLDSISTSFALKSDSKDKRLFEIFLDSSSIFTTMLEEGLL